MKDFAKSIRTCNKTIYDDSGRFIIGYVEKNGENYSAYTHGITGSKSYILDAKDEKTAEAELKDYVKAYEKRTGNKKVGNAKDKNGKDVNVGDLVKVKTDDPSLSLGKVKSVSGETIRVDMTGDDDIWTTPARLVEKVGNKKVGNSDARSQAEEAIRKIEDELKKEKPDIKKYFEIERSINKIIDDEYNRLTSQASELRGLQLRISRMEDKFI